MFLPYGTQQGSGSFARRQKRQIGGIGEFRREWLLVVAALFLLLASLQIALAADGDLDPTFGTDGKVVTDFNESTDWLGRVALQADGKIVTAGVSFPGNKYALARYNPDGTLDATFGTGGKVTTVLAGNVQGGADGLLLLPDGKIVISGSINLPSSFDTSFALLRYNSDGSLDTTFGNGGVVTTNIGPDDDQAYRLALQSDGKIVAAGRRGIHFNPTEQRKGHVGLARYNPDGSLDTSFGNGGKVDSDFGEGLESYALAVVIQPDDRIVIAGESTYAFLVARYNTDGTLDTTFASDGFALVNFSSNWDHCRDAALQPDGKIILVGIAEVNSPYDSFALARVNPDGSLDESFGTSGKVVMVNQGDLEAVVLQTDGKLIALGTSADTFKLLRFNGDGSLDSTFGTGGIVTTTFGGNPAESRDLIFQPDGKLIAAGMTSSDIYFNHSDFALARYFDTSGPVPTPTPPAATPTPTPPAATPTPTPPAATPPPTPPAATPTPTPPAATPPPTPEPTTSPGATPTPAPEPTATPGATPGAAPAQPLNISTRLRVQGGDRALIGGFILTGFDAKTVMIRAVGPSLGANGMPGALSDTTLDLYDASGQLLASNDDWTDAHQAQIQATGIAPSNALESAILTTLPGNSSYTAVVRGKNGATGVGLVEVYDLALKNNSKLANISTRGFVDTDDNVMIGGFIVGGGAADRTRVVVRAIGPSLSSFGLTNALQDPMLSLYDSNGNVLATNDNWRDGHQPEIETAGLAPTNDRESALFASLSPGAYTAIVAGKGSTTGVGLVEAYNIQ
jgi:uncharacterized delta-60 repeat protein